MPPTAIADSMYAGTVFLGGRHGELGADAVFEDVDAPPNESCRRRARRWQSARAGGGFRKLVAGKTTLEFPAKRTRPVEIGAVITQPASLSEKKRLEGPDS